MSTLSITHARPWPYKLERSPAAARPAARPGSALAAAARLAHAALREYRVRRAARQLAALSDHTLRDIGLSRGEVERAARTGRDPRGPAGGRA